MLSSEYRDRFALYRQSYEVDEWGEQKPTETIVYEGYCKPVNLTGSEYWSAYEQHMETTMKFYCRYALQFEGLDTVGLRLRWRGAFQSMGLRLPLKESWKNTWKKPTKA